MMPTASSTWVTLGMTWPSSRYSCLASSKVNCCCSLIARRSPPARYGAAAPWDSARLLQPARRTSDTYGRIGCRKHRRTRAHLVGSRNPRTASDRRCTDSRRSRRGARPRWRRAGGVRAACSLRAWAALAMLARQLAHPAQTLAIAVVAVLLIGQVDRVGIVGFALFDLLHGKTRFNRGDHRR